MADRTVDTETPVSGEGKGKRRVWELLVAYCGAKPSQYSAFDEDWPECREFRFQGNLGFGGKVWFQEHDRRARVSCYPEDLTEQRERDIATVNHLLKRVEL